jgi:hypothetical protein
VATIALTGLMAIGQGAHLTRMNIPYTLGTMFTPSRDRAKIVGLVVHHGAERRGGVASPSPSFMPPSC